MEDKNIGLQIVLARTEKGLSQSDLSKAIARSRQTIYEWEKNISTPKIEDLKKIANITNKDISFFLTSNNEDTTNEDTTSGKINTKFLNLLINWNGGIERGAQIKLAQALNISRSKISQWLSEVQKPGEININKMSAILNVPVEELKAIFGIKERAIGPGLILLPRQDYPISAVAHAGEVVFIDTKPLLRKEKIMKIFIKIADNGFLPYFQEGDIIEVETNIALKEKGICLCRDVGGKTYFLRKDTGVYPLLPGGKAAKKAVVNTVIIGWCVKKIHIEEL